MTFFSVDNRSEIVTRGLVAPDLLVGQHERVGEHGVHQGGRQTQTL